MIFHIAELQRWARALVKGAYTASTLGRELDDEGFIHCSTADQVAGVLDRFYRGVPDLVLLHIEESRLTAPLRYERVGDAPDPFPHIYGPLAPAAVVATEPIPTAPP